eukprot:TRINITY_DN6382_c5_g1_i1.p1 TRINITY_DN6382_c5_g1~~TRINITY_DN6382_c5_g1_i1.p1  ORF type:complete len:1800 (+),score=271.27 TRINITY_DN6382_c5_g1_i1:147-5402(+)
MYSALPLAGTVSVCYSSGVCVHFEELADGLCGLAAANAPHRAHMIATTSSKPPHAGAIIETPRRAAETTLRSLDESHPAALAREWVSMYSALPLAGTVSVCYSSGVCVHFEELADGLCGLAAANAPHRAHMIAAIESGELMRAALEVYAERGGDPLPGHLAWEDGGIRDYVVAVFQHFRLSPPACSQLHPVYVKFAEGSGVNSGELNTSECLCLVDAVCRALFHLEIRSPGFGDFIERLDAFSSESRVVSFEARSAAIVRGSEPLMQCVSPSVSDECSSWNDQYCELDTGSQQQADQSETSVRVSDEQPDKSASVSACAGNEGVVYEINLCDEQVSLVADEVADEVTQNQNINGRDGQEQESSSRLDVCDAHKDALHGAHDANACGAEALGLEATIESLHDKLRDRQAAYEIACERSRDERLWLEGKVEELNAAADHFYASQRVVAREVASQRTALARDVSDLGTAAELFEKHLNKVRQAERSGRNAQDEHWKQQQALMDARILQLQIAAEEAYRARDLGMNAFVEEKERGEKRVEELRKMTELLQEYELRASQAAAQHELAKSEAVLLGSQHEEKVEELEQAVHRLNAAPAQQAVGKSEQNSVDMSDDAAAISSVECRHDQTVLEARIAELSVALDKTEEAAKWNTQQHENRLQALLDDADKMWDAEVIFRSQAKQEVQRLESSRAKIEARVIDAQAAVQRSEESALREKEKLETTIHELGVRAEELRLEHNSALQELAQQRSDFQAEEVQLNRTDDPGRTNHFKQLDVIKSETAELRMAESIAKAAREENAVLRAELSQLDTTAENSLISSSTHSHSAQREHMQEYRKGNELGSTAATTLAAQREALRVALEARNELKEEAGSFGSLALEATVAAERATHAEQAIQRDAIQEELAQRQSIERLQAALENESRRAVEAAASLHKARDEQLEVLRHELEQARNASDSSSQRARAAIAEEQHFFEERLKEMRLAEDEALRAHHRDREEMRATIDSLKAANGRPASLEEARLSTSRTVDSRSSSHETARPTPASDTRVEVRRVLSAELPAYSVVARNAAEVSIDSLPRAPSRAPSVALLAAEQFVTRCKPLPSTIQSNTYLGNFTVNFVEMSAVFRDASPASAPHRNNISAAIDQGEVLQTAFAIFKSHDIAGIGYLNWSDGSIARFAEAVLRRYNVVPPAGELLRPLYEKFDLAGSGRLDATTSICFIDALLRSMVRSRSRSALPMPVERQLSLRECPYAEIVNADADSQQRSIAVDGELSEPVSSQRGSLLRGRAKSVWCGRSSRALRKLMTQLPLEIEKMVIPELSAGGAKGTYLGLVKVDFERLAAELAPQSAANVGKRSKMLQALESGGLAHTSHQIFEGTASHGGVPVLTSVATMAFLDAVCRYYELVAPDAQVVHELFNVFDAESEQQLGIRESLCLVDALVRGMFFGASNGRASAATPSTITSPTSAPVSVSGAPQAGHQSSGGSCAEQGASVRMRVTYADSAAPVVRAPAAPTVPASPTVSLGSTQAPSLQSPCATAATSYVDLAALAVPRPVARRATVGVAHAALAPGTAGDGGGVQRVSSVSSVLDPIGSPHQFGQVQRLHSAAAVLDSAASVRVAGDLNGVQHMSSATRLDAAVSPRSAHGFGRIYSLTSTGTASDATASPRVSGSVVGVQRIVTPAAAIDAASSFSSYGGACHGGPAGVGGVRRLHSYTPRSNQLPVSSSSPAVRRINSATASVVSPRSHVPQAAQGSPSLMGMPIVRRG